MLLRQLWDAETFSYTYLVADLKKRQAIFIDPVREQLARDLQLLTELDLELRYVLETHLHADHITSAGLLCDKTGAQSVVSHHGAQCADIHCGMGDRLVFGDLECDVLETPGHTDDSLTFRIGNNLFTGDALLVRTCGRTDFQNGDAGKLYDVVTNLLFSHPDSTLIWPGHDYKGHSVSSVGEEKRFNARLVGRTREEFIELMGSLKLAPPKRINEAVPANRLCGRVG